MKIQDCLAQNAIISKKRIHDCADFGNEYTFTDTVAVNFPCDGLQRNYKTDTDIYTIATSKFKDSIENSIIHFKIKANLKGNKEDRVQVRMYIDNEDAGYPQVAIHDWVLHYNNLYREFEWSSFVYNGSDAAAHINGFIVELIPEGTNIKMANRSILLAV
jgi:hypothetical protein